MLPRDLPSREDHLQASLKGLAEHFNPATTAHLSIDMQRLYCDRDIPLIRNGYGHNYFDRANSLLRATENFAAAFRKAGGLNVWVRHVVELHEAHYDFNSDGLNEEGRLTKVMQFNQQALEMCIPADVEKDLTVDKRLFNSFLCSKLETTLRQRNIDTVLISGCLKMTCVLKTAFGAKEANFKTYLLEDLLLEKKSSDEYDRLVFCEDRIEEKIYPVSSAGVRCLLGPQP